MDDSLAALEPQLRAIFSDLRAAFQNKRLLTFAELDKQLVVAENQLNKLLHPPRPGAPVAPPAAPARPPLAALPGSANRALPAPPARPAPTSGVSSRPAANRSIGAAASFMHSINSQAAAIAGDFPAASNLLKELIPTTAEQPERVLEALQSARPLVKTSQHANELRKHVDTAREAAPMPPHPIYEQLAALEALVVDDCIRLCTRLDEALALADFFWKHHGHQSLTAQAYDRAVEVACDVNECLMVARKARLRYEEVGIKEPGQAKASSFKRKAPFGNAAQLAVNRARALGKTAQDLQAIAHQVHALETEFEHLRLESPVALR